MCSDILVLTRLARLIGVRTVYMSGSSSFCITKARFQTQQSEKQVSFEQEELAKKAGIDSNSYAKVERGESRPYGVTLVKIIRALGVKSSDILPV